MKIFEILFWVLAASVFNSVRGAPMPALTVSNCNETDDCTKTVYSTLFLTQEDNSITSHFGARMQVQKLAGAVTQENDTHLFHHSTSSSDGLTRYEASIGKVGTKEHSGISFGYGLTATAGEIGGKIGKGAYSVGGKLGFSADTGFVLGPHTEVKILGTGVGIGAKDGLSFCLWGSCISFG